MITHLQPLGLHGGDLGLGAQYRYMSSLSSNVQVCWAWEHSAPVVIKRIHHSQSTAYTSQLLDALRASPHANILRLLRVHQLAKGGSSVVVSEWLQQGDLADRITPFVGMPELDVVYFARQIASGLAHLHGLGYCHRDLKPDNIGFCREHDYAPFTIKILDLDSAVPLSAELVDKYCGTVPYMSPELLDDVTLPHELDLAKADVWSFGIILFVMLTGRFPWTKAMTDARDFVRATSANRGIAVRECIQRTGDGRAAPRVSPAMEKLLGNTLRLRASERWSAQQICDFFAEQWPEDYAPPLTPRAVALYPQQPSASQSSCRAAESNNRSSELCEPSPSTAQPGQA